ncbi:MAG: hypothetical protein JWN79_3310 [Gemmatimonadetes bacterium]|jgi:hypothetical protein|nr:hypothetical protein [Gemmatimonadota bacterium]
MPLAPLPPRITKPLVAVLLALMLVGGAAMLIRGPAHHYAVTCTKAQQIQCVVERATSSGIESRPLVLGPDAAAAVRIATRRRGPARVFLYLHSGSRDVFAAEFEGSTADADAEAAAAALTRVFASEGPATARVEAQPPAYLRWLAWGILGVMALLVFAVYRKLFMPEGRPDSSSEPPPLGGVA